MTCGVYLIRNTVNGKVYVGSSIHVEKRFRKHASDLKAGRHRSRHLQSAWEFYGEDCFEFCLMELCHPSMLLLVEQSYIDRYRSYDRENGYNTCMIAGNSLGVKRSEETKQKLRELNTGKKIDPAMAKQWGAARKGQKRKPLTEQHKQKLRASRIGRPLSEEHRAKIKANAARGDRNSMFGRRGELSPHYGRPCSSETREKISAKQRGIPKTESQRKKLSAANARFTTTDIEEMLSLRGKGFTQQEIATVFNCSRPHVSCILSGKYIAYRTDGQ